IAVDAVGAMYVTGLTASADFPRVGSIQVDQASDDVIVTKLDASGSQIVYSTYIGGNGSDGAIGIVVDASGSAYVAGGTLSSDYPVTTGAFQGPQPDVNAFVTKLSPSGGSLVYSTYVGGNRREEAGGITVDDQGQAYITG